MAFARQEVRASAGEGSKVGSDKAETICVFRMGFSERKGYWLVIAVCA
jgi:hypothetical protein